ncbi:MAG: ribosome silencing factor [Chitinophagales bacterium]
MTEQLVDIVADSILDKKGEKVISMNLSNLEDAMTDSFVICEANSTRQVGAIADNIIEQTKELLNESPVYVEGKNTSEWVLLDYINVVVHVFLRPKRYIYQLEELWGDAAITTEHFPDGTQRQIDYRTTSLSSSNTEIE